MVRMLDTTYIREIRYLPVSNPVATGGFFGLIPPKKAPSPSNLKYETLYISGVFVKF